MHQGRFKGFLLRDKEFPSRSVYKRAVLRAQLSLLGVSVGLIYTVLDYWNHLYVSIPFYLVLIFLCGIVFLINRSGNYRRADFIFLPMLVFLIYVFADNDVNHTGVGAYFIAYSLIALTLCGYEQLGVGLFFSCLAVIGFFAAY